LRFNHRFAVAVLAIGLSLGGCAKLVEATQFISTASAAVEDLSVSPEMVLIASNSFDAVQVTATNYLRLKRCTGDNGPICRDPAVTPSIIAMIKAGRVARDDLQKFMRDHPGSLGKTGLYSALTQSVTTIQAMMATYIAATAGAKP
jgi:hypothetical protein